MYVCIQGMNSDLQSKEVDPDMAILNAIVCMKLARRDIPILSHRAVVSETQG